MILLVYQQALVMVMMMTRIFSLSLFFICLNITADNLTFDFKIQNVKKDINVIELQAKAKANKIIRDNAFLSFNIDNDNLYECWGEYIKNKKINISTSDSYYKLIKQDNNFNQYRLFINTDKIKVQNTRKSDLLLFCSNYNQN